MNLFYSNKYISVLKPKFLKYFLLLFLMVAFLSYFLFFDEKLLIFKNINELFIKIQELSNNNYFFSISIFIFIYIFSTSISLPIATLLTVFSGAIFGWLAVPIIVFSATMGATIIFYLVKSSLGKIYINKVESKFNYLKKGFQKDSFYFLLFLRLLPIAPFFIVNILAGIFNLNLAKFIFATAIGILPASCIFIWVGKTSGELISYKEISNIELIFLKFFPPLFLLALISLLPIILRKMNIFFLRRS